MPRVSRLLELQPGLLRWTVSHPDWEPDAKPESPADWPEDVGSVLYEAPSATVFVDPLVPEELWPELDERVASRGLPVQVLTTIRWHVRSRDEVLARYEGSDAPAEGVETLELPGLGETMYWLPEPRALVAGDRLIGDGAGGVRMCPQSWFALSGTLEDLRSALRPALDLPVELLLVSHGEPVLERGGDALALALA
jgi:glyoxylase-like metal-dependent hydrolase (beta-lactamase superfamily II)